MSTLDQKLNRNAQREILSDLLDMDVDDDGVIYDEDGDEFYGFACNDGVDLETLRGIITYLIERAEERGKFEKEQEIIKVLGVQ